MKLNANNFITMYRNVDFNPNDNITFDDIEKHLELFSKYSPIDVGPNKFLDEKTINGTIRLNRNDSRYLDYLSQQVNYCSVKKTEDSTPHSYYFVTNIKYLSEEVVELTLQLDTLNTYSKFVTDSNYWSTRTVTSRQHKDRFDSNQNPLFDKFDEGLGSLPMYKISNETLKQTSDDVDWYLVYRSESDDENAPIKCNIYTSKSTKVSLWRPTALGLTGNITGVYYWDTRYHADGKPHTMLFNSNGSFGGATEDVMWVLIDGPNKKIYYGLSDSKYGTDNAGSAYYNSWSNPHVIDFDTTKATYLGQMWTWNSTTNYKVIGWPYALKSNNNFYWYYYTTAVTRLYIAGSGMSSLYYAGHSDYDWTISSINNVDRTDSALNKIIECPYCPLSFANGVISNCEPGSYDGRNSDDHFGPLEISTKQKQAFISTVSTSKLVEITLPATRTTSDNKSSDYEPKLLTSQFHKYKFTYDSFTKELKTELFNNNNTNYIISYSQSLDMSSTLLFKFGCDYAEDDDYTKYLTCSRNNETAIYTSSYLNYIRTGFNYDLKTKALNNVKNGLAIGSSVIGVAGSVGMTLASGGTLGAISTVQQVVGLTTNISNVVMSQISNDNAIQQKKDEALASSVGVSNVDDLSLLKIYGGNRLSKYEYSIRDGLKNSIYEMFYLTGYACNDYGRPDLKSRSNFNYIKASTTIDTLVTANNECKNDIVNRIANGILIIHKCEDAIGALFNYENWEDHLLSS